MTASSDESRYLHVDIRRQIASDFVLEIAFSSRAKCVGVLGASGAGKSSLLRCLAGLDMPDSGRIQWVERVVFDSSRSLTLPSRDRRVGMVFQNYALFPHLTVADNVAFGLARSAAQDGVLAQLAAVRMASYADRFPHQLSGGQQQRVALARALASQPDLLLLDEPFSALDPHLRDRLSHETMARLRAYSETDSGTVVLVTHDLDEAFQYCDELLVLDRGRAIASGSTRDMFERPPTLAAARLTGCQNVSRAIARDAMEIEALDWGCRLRPIAPVTPSIHFVGIRAQHLSLSDALTDDRALACWPASTCELPSSVKLFVKLQHPPHDVADYHLQLHLPVEQWRRVCRTSPPWYVRLDPAYLLVWTE